MPNRTIYVADSDLPIFEKAQKLAGDNLSAAIAYALRRFVEREEARQQGFEDIIVKVGKGRPYVQKQFRGHPIAKRRLSLPEDARMLTMVVYQTAKGHFAVYTKNQPNWENWGHQWAKRGKRGKNWDLDVDVDVNMGKSSWQGGHEWDWQSYYQSNAWDWKSYYQNDEYRLDVYDSLDELKENIPEEMYDAIVRYLKGDEIEILDI